MGRHCWLIPAKCVGMMLMSRETTISGGSGVCEERGRRSGRVRGGSITVELALITPLLLLLLFSIIEVGFMVQNRTALGQAAREGARLGAVGVTVSQVDEAIDQSLNTISPSAITRTYQFRRWNQNTQTWMGWETLTDSGGRNIAPRGSQLRIGLHFQHQLMIPGLMGPLLKANEDGEVRLEADSLMMRE